MKIAIEGCAHGELEKIYETIEFLEKENKLKVDLLICCGDFQASRNLDDLQCMAVPNKFKSICSFYKYYSGEKTAPILTIFIGGNHEASNHLQELPYGGWAAPNIYYMGYAGVVNVNGVRIAGLSGIFKGRDYHKGRYERPPYSADTLRSCYHIRSLDVFRLKQVSGNINIFLSHDWPAGVYHHGNVQQLLKRKPYFKEDIESESLGSRPAGELLEHVKPDYWFSAHLHVKFPAIVHHSSDKKTTKFLALDKCLPKRQFLQVVDVPHDDGAKIQLSYDLEWLAILQLTNHLLNVKRVNSYMPGPTSGTRSIFTPTNEELEKMRKRFPAGLEIPTNFVKTVPVFDPEASGCNTVKILPVVNSQTTELCDLLGIDDPMVLLLGDDSFTSDSSFNVSNCTNPDVSSFITSTDSEADSFLSPSPQCRPSPLRLPPVVGSQLTPPSRTPLKLPKPSTTDVALTSTPCHVSPPAAPEPSLLPQPNFSDVSTDSVSNVSDAADSTAPGPKRFRRRNFNMYATMDEDVT